MVVAALATWAKIFLFPQGPARLLATQDIMEYYIQTHLLNVPCILETCSTHAAPVVFLSNNSTGGTTEVELCTGGAGRVGFGAGFVCLFGLSPKGPCQFICLLVLFIAVVASILLLMVCIAVLQHIALICFRLCCLLYFLSEVTEFQFNLLASLSFPGKDVKMEHKCLK